MRRFRSTLQRIQRLQRQQLRMTELSVARALQEMQAAQRELQQLLKDHCRTDEQRLLRSLSADAAPLTAASLHSIRSRIESWKAGVLAQQQLCTVRQQQMQQLRDVLQSQQARSDATGRILEQQKRDHVLEALHREQLQLDETAVHRQERPGTDDAPGLVASGLLSEQGSVES
jgi:flagellar biosynthesis chaperone FliJ